MGKYSEVSDPSCPVFPSSCGLTHHPMGGRTFKNVMLHFCRDFIEEGKEAVHLLLGLFNYAGLKCVLLWLLLLTP